MWVLGQTGALGINRLCNGHGDVTAVSTGPPPVMDLGTKRPGLLGGPVERTTHRPRFGASPSLLCSSGTKKRTKSHEAGFFFWVPDGSRLGLKYRISYQTHVTGLKNVC